MRGTGSRLPAARPAAVSIARPIRREIPRPASIRRLSSTDVRPPPGRASHLLRAASGRWRRSVVTPASTTPALEPDRAAPGPGDRSRGTSGTLSTRLRARRGDGSRRYPPTAPWALGRIQGRIDEGRGRSAGGLRGSRPVIVGPSSTPRAVSPALLPDQGGIAITTRGRKAPGSGNIFLGKD